MAPPPTITTLASRLTMIPRFDSAHTVDLVNANAHAGGPLRIRTIGRESRPCDQVRGDPAVASAVRDCCDPVMAELTDPFVDSGDRLYVRAMFWKALTGSDQTPPLVRED